MGDDEEICRAVNGETQEVMAQKSPKDSIPERKTHQLNQRQQQLNEKEGKELVTEFCNVGVTNKL